MSENAHTASAPPKRSPSYPAISLRTAVERLRQLYSAERSHPAPIETAVKHWGYSGPNGRTAGIIGALKKYGLIVDSGSGRGRKIQVTDAGRRILEHPDPAEREAALQKAALLPRLHREMWDKYGAGMPTDDTWVWELREDRDFTDVGAREFVKQYRDTISYSGLLDSHDPDDVSDEVEDGEDLEEGDFEISPGGDGATNDFDAFMRNFDQKKAAARRRHLEARGREAAREMGFDLPRNPAVQSYSLPMGPGRPPVEIRGEFPLSSAEWKVLIASLDIWKSMLVSDAEMADEPVDKLDDEDRHENDDSTGLRL